MPWKLRFVLLFALPSLVGAKAEEGDYLKSIEDYRQQRIERLKAPDGWLAVAGFAWLEPGENAFGSDPALPVVLPDGPKHAGSIFYDPDSPEATVTMSVDAGVPVLIGEDPVRERVILPGPDGKDVLLRLGRLTFWAMARGDGHAIRIRDPESPFRKAFTAIAFYDTNPAYRVAGHFVEPGAYRKIEVPNVMGYTTEDLSPGPVEFALHGESLRLVPTVESEGDSVLFFVFADSTTGVETYGGGRFLYADLQEDGSVTLDFNKAYNPPCAFTPYATCPLPPEGNKLPVAVRSGEKAYEMPGKQPH